jgi:hypothetical protein
MQDTIWRIFIFLKLAKRDRMNFPTILLFFKNSKRWNLRTLSQNQCQPVYGVLNIHPSIKLDFVSFRRNFCRFSVCSVSTACGECRNISIVSLDESIQMFAPRLRSLKIRENDFTNQNILAWRLRVSGQGPPFMASLVSVGSRVGENPMCIVSCLNSQLNSPHWRILFISFILKPMKGGISYVVD